MTAPLALGGGSVIDTAKAIGMLAVNGGNVEDYQMNGKQVTAVPPLFIAVPTTSGTGAEATKTSVVLNNYNGLKKSLYHTTMIADIVILDPSPHHRSSGKDNGRNRHGCPEPRH